MRSGDVGYVRDADEIYARSFAIIRGEADLARFDDAEAEVAVRMIHACGMVELTAAIVFSPGAVAAGIRALRDGAPILCDTEMVAHGITRKRLPSANDVICTLGDPRVADLAKRSGTTRSAAAVDLWGERIGGAVIAIGNAPTALFRLLELLDAGAPKPALVVGCPVGFVGAAESKDALAAANIVPFVTVRGRLGGSAVTAAALNALAGLAR